MVEIVPYRDAWPTEFQTLAGMLRRGVGDLALRIDHIGSTSVPGLAAKDVIDVQITVAALDDELLSRLLTLGYERVGHIAGDHLPPDDNGDARQWAKWYFRAPAGQRRTNTHVRIAGRPNQVYPLLFRDFLRAHSPFASAYAELKRRLARELRDIDTYPDVKDPACDLIYLAAREWAERTNWQPGPSDA